MLYFNYSGHFSVSITAVVAFFPNCSRNELSRLLKDMRHVRGTLESLGGIVKKYPRKKGDDVYLLIDYSLPTYVRTYEMKAC